MNDPHNRIRLLNQLHGQQRQMTIPFWVILTNRITHVNKYTTQRKPISFEYTHPNESHAMSIQDTNMNLMLPSATLVPCARDDCTTAAEAQAGSSFSASRPSQSNDDGHARRAGSGNRGPMRIGRYGDKRSKWRAQKELTPPQPMVPPSTRSFHSCLRFPRDVVVTSFLKLTSSIVFGCMNLWELDLDWFHVNLNLRMTLLRTDNNAW